jgi:hypothetical protein
MEALALLPGQSAETPTPNTGAVMMDIQVALEPLGNIINFAKSIGYQELACLQRTLSATAYKDCGRTISAAIDSTHPTEQQLPDLLDEMRVDVPLRLIDPGYVDGSGRMADKEIFHVGAHIDQESPRIFLYQIPSLLR